MAWFTKTDSKIGYLPDEQPPFWKLLLYAIQQVIVMFPATIAVALITGFHISTTIFASGFATLCFILVTKGKIPLYYGSSFSYIAAIFGLLASEGLANLPLDEKISIATFGIVMSGLVSIAAGLIVNKVGREVIEKILPATITGPIAMIIGLTLAGNALADAAPAEAGPGIINNLPWIVSLATLLSTILFSVYLKGFWSQLPLFLGMVVGALVAGIILATTKVNLFRQLPETVAHQGLFALPHFTIPKIYWPAAFAIMPVALATIPESTAHIYQLDVYVNDLAKKIGTEKKYDIANRLGSNLIGDGIGDIVAGFVGGPAGTNYGENISTMAITKVFSVPVLIAAAIIAMIIACFTPLVKAIYAIPLPVIGGLEIYLFGAIAAQGIAIMIDKGVDMFSAKNIAVIATIMVIGLGGHYAFGGVIPFFGIELPALATAAIFGILLNLLLNIKKKEA
ncbi:MAG TPA: solute carrier family 23 protein [Anaerolineaceae bacterium]|nr:xanthine permease [Chloroflexota bacterium]HNY84506.1 solute carrier family 23 protein [Anaerolineaceae bacterium]